MHTVRLLLFHVQHARTRHWGSTWGGPEQVEAGLQVAPSQTSMEATVRLL